MTAKVGMVYLVGAGPGDPGLITVRGLSLLRRADVVVYDRLIPKELLAETRPGAELVDAGKSRGEAELSQGEIGSLLVEHAQRGRRVVRLKGGDPFMFGRGYEELAACREANVPCTVVSGVTSAVAVPAAAGIPITNRRWVRSVAIVTGSVASEAESAPLDFVALSRIDTVVILMGRENLGELMASFAAGGRDPSTPVAVIHSGTTPAQRVLRGTLSTIAKVVEAAQMSAPVVTVVGRVAALARDDGNAHGADDDFREIARVAVEPETAQTIRTGPLSGRRIVVTRARAQSRGLVRRLERLGAAVIPVPLLRIIFPPLTDHDRATLLRLDTFDRIVFTSVNGVRGFFRALRAVDRDVRSLGRCRIAAVGAVTGRALRRRGLGVDVIPSRQDVAGLEAKLGGSARRLDDCGCASESGATLIVRGDLAPSTLQTALARRGECAESVTVYRNEPRIPTEHERSTIARGVDAVLFYSASAVARFTESRLELGEAVVACIGPTTAEAARRAGMEVAVVAEEPSDAAMVAALVRRFSPNR